MFCNHYKWIYFLVSSFVLNATSLISNPSLKGDFTIGFPLAQSDRSKFRFGFGPSIGFYSVNLNHSSGARPRASLQVNLKRQFRMDREHKNFLLIGLDYMFHGITFNSYYFQNDSLQLYDKNFAFRYSLFMQEASIPIEYKYSFKPENNSLYSAYFMFGYRLRYLFPLSVNVTENGNSVSVNSEALYFVNPFIFKKMNSAIHTAFGFQRNGVGGSDFNFFIELNYRYNFSPYYFKTDYSASSLIFNSQHLSLQLGLKF
jgi:hypothetical protein